MQLKLWEIHGIHSSTNQPMTVYVISPREADARDFAAARGIAVHTLRSIRPSEVPPDTDISTYRLDVADAPSSADPESLLLRHPILTIASGVFLGLLFYAIVMLMLGILRGSLL